MTDDFIKEHTKIAKGFAIIFMIILHLFAHDGWLYKNNCYTTIFNIGGTSLDVIISGFGKICVAMYLFLSGYGLYKTYIANKGFTYKDSYMRIKNLYINYILILIIFIPIGYALGVYKEPLTIYRFLINIFCLDFYYNSFAWFIRLYFILLLIFPFLVKILDKSLIKNMIIIVTLATTHIILNKVQFEINYWDINLIGNLGVISEVNSIVLWSIHFIIGITCAKFNLYTFTKEKLKLLSLDKKMFYIFCFVACILLRNILPYKEILDGLYAPLTIMSLSSIIYESKSENIFKYLGEHSTNLWLIHFYFTYKYFQSIIYYPKYTVLILIWSFIVMIPISICINELLKITKLSLGKRVALEK